MHFDGFMVLALFPVLVHKYFILVYFVDFASCPCLTRVSVTDCHSPALHLSSLPSVFILPVFLCSLPDHYLWFFFSIVSIIPHAKFR